MKTDKNILSDDSKAFIGITIGLLFLALIGGMFEEIWSIVLWIYKFLPLIVLVYILYRVNMYYYNLENDLTELIVLNKTCEKAFKEFFVRNHHFRGYSFDYYLMKYPLSLRFYNNGGRPIEVKEFNKIIRGIISDPNEHQKSINKLIEITSTRQKSDNY